MNILICVFTYYPSTNGVQHVTAYQAEGLVKLGHDVTVLTGYPNGKIEESQEIEIHNGVKIKRFNAFTDFMLHFGDRKEYQKMVRSFAQTVDVIMAVCPESWCVDWIIPIAKELPCGLMMMVHGIHDSRWSTFTDRSLYGIARKIWGDIRWPTFYSLNWNNINSFDVVAHLHEEDYGAQLFRNNGVQSNEILYNAVDDVFFDDYDQKKEKCIVNIGTYTERKNQILCLDSFYRSGLTDYQLVLIGPQKNKYYQKLVDHKNALDQKYGKRDVHILTEQPRDEVVRWIKKANIYLLTSITEKFPVSLIEGMAAGAAFVSTDVGIDRYLPGGVIANSAEEIAHALKKLAANDMWREYGIKGRTFAFKNCGTFTQIKRLEKLLLQAKDRSEKENRKLGAVCGTKMQ